MRFVLFRQARGVDRNGDDVVGGGDGLRNPAVEDQEAEDAVVGCGLQEGELAGDFVSVGAACGV